MTTNNTLLSEGIAAAKLGQRERARDLLMQVVAADERSEQGWLWLSGVVDDPADQRVCLENVLDINPRSQQAQKGLAWLDARYPVQVQAAPDSAPLELAVGAVPVAPATPVGPTVDDIVIPAGPLPQTDNPCPFCGSPTRLDQQRCVQCKNSLMVRDAPDKRRSIATGILAILWFISAALSVLGLVVFAGLVYGQSDILQQLPSTRLEALQSSAPLTLGIGVLYILIALMIGVGLWRKQRWAFFAHIVMSILGVMTSALLVRSNQVALLAGVGQNSQALQQANQLTTGACLSIVVFFTIVLTFLSYGDFFGKMVRVLTTVPERDDDDHYNMGVIYKNRGMWYMATKEWEGATKKRPSDPEYRRALGLAYAQIKQFGRAVRELREAVRLRTTDQRIKEDLALVEQMALKELRNER